MATAVTYDTPETLELSRVVRGALLLGVLQTICVVLVSVVNHLFDGVIDHALTGVIVAIGIAATVVLPAIWLRVRGIDGISAAAGVGLGAALVFMVIDPFLLQPFGVYTNRWHEIGGGSNWWYHPVWWMISAYLAWLGAWVVANYVRRGSSAAIALAVIAVLAVVIGAIAAVAHFPGASFNVPTFAVAVLPALAVATLLSERGARRG